MKVGTKITFMRGKRKGTDAEVWATCGGDQTCIVRFQNHFNNMLIVTKWLPWSYVKVRE